MERPQSSNPANSKGSQLVPGRHAIGIRVSENKTAENEEKINKQVSVPDKWPEIEMPKEISVSQRTKQRADTSPAVQHNEPLTWHSNSSSKFLLQFKLP